MIFASSRAIALAVLVSVTLLVGCSTPEGNDLMRNPAITVKFESISADEQKFIEKEMRKEGAIATGPLQYILPLRYKESLTAEQLGKEISRWHAIILDIRNDEGVQIAQNNRVGVDMAYVSSKAISGSGAKMFIIPKPRNAKLYIDTPIPGIASMLNPDGSVRINASGQFETGLSFSFIRNNDRVYFRTRYLGSVRYFYYDIGAQQQVQVPNVRNQADWDYYRKNKRLPSD